ncbi:MAG: hypothetical protein WC635_11305 [Bacteriovorax sp.]|jgi:hypothetical protein
MKKTLLAFTLLLPALSIAGVYNCSGSGFIIDIAGMPLEMKIVGNGFNTMVTNVRATSNFDTIITGSTLNPPSSLKVTIKDSSFGNPGDSFKGNLQVSTPEEVKEYRGLNCIRGND